MAYHDQLSRKGLRFIARWESYTAVAAHFYGEQYCTWGYGHYGADVPCGQFIGIRKARKLLREDCVFFERIVRQAVKVPLDQQQFDALVSFTYNVGYNNFLNSSLLIDLNAGHYGLVPGQMRRWVNGANGPVLGLVNRREAEVKIWREGRYR